MNQIKKILIYINKNNKEFSTTIFYTTENDLQSVFNMDEYTTNATKKLFKKINQNKLLISKNDKIYYYNTKNKTTELITSIKDYENYCYAGSNLKGTITLIRHIKHYANKRENLALVYVQCNNKIYCLNECIISKKRGAHQEKRICDLEIYLNFIKEFNHIILTK